ncbi:GTP-binding protein, partial [Streptomyces sp. NPDC057545]|uniref:GTP-binding protein n=1 Tax=Streptomyces sp. NPDC057545 TaxID=3346164 RepID=UPI00369A92C2
MTEVGATTVGIGRDGGSISKGDAGGPTLREKDGDVELVAVHSASWQAGCLGSDATRGGEAALSRTEERLVEMTNGCICCTLRDDLLEEVDRLAR